MQEGWEEGLSAGWADSPSSGRMRYFMGNVFEAGTWKCPSLAWPFLALLPFSSVCFFNIVYIHPLWRSYSGLSRTVLIYACFPCFQYDLTFPLIFIFVNEVFF